MSSARDDLTTRARIRDAAVAAFASSGFARTTIRRIAGDAGVSPALVMHHFGSKAELRSACDDYVFAELLDSKRSAAIGGGPAAVVSAITGDERMRAVVDYMLASLLDPSEHGQRYFDSYVDLVEGLLRDGFAGYTFRRSEDARAQAAAVAILGLTPVMLQHRVQHSLGTAGTPETLARLMPQMLDLYKHGVIADSPDDQPDPDLPQDTDPTERSTS
ncbi:TetR family transcriptional regulator [Microbacterium halophytorum]|uniref:TetR family transcriptional regulator n=1 Tax=Microbacterium halophytorum TaxID=2067568 RepID=UPI001E41E46F|nr:TetR family transcriptional regulator [Microbacterium halophytorum]